MKDNKKAMIFNSPLEIGSRVLSILVTAFPLFLDINRLLQYDYLLIHSGNFDGPESLHPSLPLRAGELLIRRKLIESGLLLMMSRNLVGRELTSDGIFFLATDSAYPFLSNLSSPYMEKVKKRAVWVVNTFSEYTNDELSKVMNKEFDKWTMEFQPHQKRIGL